MEAWAFLIGFNVCAALLALGTGLRAHAALLMAVVGLLLWLGPR